MEYVKSLKWHCHHCGAGVDPRDKHCSYCGSPTKHRAILGDKNIRVFAETEKRKVYLHEVTEISVFQQEPRMIETARLEDTRLSRVVGFDRGVFSMDMRLTENSFEKADLLADDGNKLSISIETDFGNYKIGCSNAYIGTIECRQGEVVTFPVQFEIEQFGGLEKDTIWLNDGCTCPNCGAKLRKRFGLCDYCGGWSQYVNAYV